MILRNKRIAILFFSRDAFAESMHKPLLGTNERKKNVELAQLMINQTRKSLDESGLDIVHFTQHNQSGNSFGEKLANAFHDVFSMGYESVIAIGNDTPEIAHIDWNFVRLQLQKNKAVVGPTQRGGAYLIGLNQNQFDKTGFETLTWQGKDLFADLLLFLENEHSSVEVLAPMHELNRQNDIHWFLNSSDQKWQFIRLLMQLISSKKMGAIPLVFLLLQDCSWFSKNFRGPPTVRFDSFIQDFKTVLNAIFQCLNPIFVKGCTILHLVDASQSTHRRGPPILNY